MMLFTAFDQEGTLLAEIDLGPTAIPLYDVGRPARWAAAKFTLSAEELGATRGQGGAFQEALRAEYGRYQREMLDRLNREIFQAGQGR